MTDDQIDARPCQGFWLAVPVLIALAAAVGAGCDADVVVDGPSGAGAGSDGAKGGVQDSGPVGTDGTTGGEPGRSLRGVVSLGAPVADAQMQARPLSGDLDDGAPIATTVTDDDGWFELLLPPETSPGLLLIRARGTSAQYALPDREEAFEHDDELTAIIAYDGEAAAGLSVNAWTTIAAELAWAYRAEQELAPEDAVAMAHRRIGDHVWRPDEHDIRLVGVMLPSTNGFNPEHPSGTLGLTHAGMARLSEEWSEQASVPVSLVDVAGLLALDLRDGRFDGMAPAAGGPPVSLTIAGAALLDADTTRFALAKAIYGSVPPELGASLLAPEELLPTLSLDDGPLYPAVHPPKPFDPLPPEMQWLEAPPEGEVLPGGFVAQVEANDESGVASIAVTSPAGAALSMLSDHVARITVGVDERRDGALVLAVEATDEEGNTATLERTVHIDRAPPNVSQVKLDGAKSLGPGFGTAKSRIVLHATADDPPPAQGDCAGLGSVTLLEGASSTPLSPSPEGNVAAVVPLSPGVQTLQIVAEDLVGNSTNDSPYTVSVLMDATAPSLSVTSPTTLWTNVDPPLLKGTAEDKGGAGGLAVVVQNEVTDQSVLAVLGGDSTWSANPPTGASEAGMLSYAVEATDALGNAEKLTLSIGLDMVAPSLDLDPAAPALSMDGEGKITWYTSEGSIGLSGELNDDDSGPASVTVQGPGGVTAAEAEMNNEGVWSAPPVEVLTGPPTTFTVTGSDVAGNTTEEPVTVEVDTTPPEIAVLSPISEDHWTQESTIEVDGVATDAGAGVAKVWLEINGTSEPVETWGSPKKGEVEWTHDVHLGQGGLLKLVQGFAGEDGQYVVKAWAEDALGHTSEPVVRVIYRDSVDPVISLKETLYFPETLGTLEASESGPSFNPGGIKAVAINDAVCGGTSNDCGPLVKFAHRLEYDASADDELDNNFPTFEPLISDESPADVPNSLVATYSFVHEQGATPEQPIPGEGVPVAAQYIWPDGPTVPGPDTPLPVGIIFRAIDLAGNETKMEYTFDFVLKTPPLYMESVPLPGGPPVSGGVPLSFAQETAHVPFHHDGAPIVLARLKVPNYYPLPIALLAKPSGAQVEAILTTEPTYIKHGPSSEESPCGVGTCQQEDSTCAASAGGAEGVASVTAGLDALVVTDADSGEPAEVDAYGRAVLAPGATYNVDVAASFADTCLMLAPLPVPVWSYAKEDYDFEWTYLHDGESAACALSGVSGELMSDMVCTHASQDALCSASPWHSWCTVYRSWWHVRAAHTLRIEPYGGSGKVLLESMAAKAGPTDLQSGVNAPYLDFDMSVSNDATTFMDSPFGNATD